MNYKNKCKYAKIIAKPQLNRALGLKIAFGIELL